MEKVLLFGGTGNLGSRIAEELVRQNYFVTAVVRNEDKAAALQSIVQQTIIRNVMNPVSLIGIAKGYEVVVSALGKSVSLNDKSKPSFTSIDLDANSFILDEALRSGVKKFVYVSALHAERYPHLEYFRVHHEFSERLKQSGLDYSIIKPPALFSTFSDLIDLAKRGFLVTMGKGDKVTNPIFEGDLSKICIEGIDQTNSEIEAGGQEILSRKEINERIQRVVNPQKKVRSVPIGLMKSVLPFVKLFSKNTYDKFAFFLEVMEHDTLAPQVGETKLEDYIKAKTSF